MQFQTPEERNQWIEGQLENPTRFIQWIISKHYDQLQASKSISNIDLLQEGWIALINKAEDYGPYLVECCGGRWYELKSPLKEYYDGEWYELRTKFSTYAKPRVEGRIQNRLNEAFRTKLAEADKHTKKDLKKVFDSEDEAGKLEYNYSGSYDESTEPKAQLENALDSLGSREREILELFSAGVGQSTIGERFDVKQSRVSQIKSEAVEKIREQLTGTVLEGFFRLLNTDQTKGPEAQGYAFKEDRDRIKNEDQYTRADAEKRNQEQKYVSGPTRDKKYPAGAVFPLLYCYNKEYDPNEDKIDNVKYSASGHFIFRPGEGCYKIPKKTGPSEKKEKFNASFPVYPAWRICPKCFSEFKVKERWSEKSVCKSCRKNQINNFA